MFNSITIVGGKDKNEAPEKISTLTLRPGEIMAVVGITGSGKSLLIADLEQWAGGETPSARRILINQRAAHDFAPGPCLRRMTAEVSQNMNFFMDMNVQEFLYLHACSRDLKEPEILVKQVLLYANRLSGEPLHPGDRLTVLSGGQSRALMIADVALISDAPIVLLDELENAGIDRLAALKGLTMQNKIVVLVTHDPLLALLAERRLVMKNGGMFRLHKTSSDERRVLSQLVETDRRTSFLRDQLRQGETLNKWAKERER